VVREANKKDKTLFICEECGLVYEQKEWAEKCQQWCRENQSCNLEIIQHSLQLEQSD